MRSVCSNSANDLLPWYLNGSLKPEDQERVRVHLNDCEVCGREIDVLAAVAREAGRHDVGILDPDASGGPQEHDERQGRRAWPVAAALAVPMALGVWWLTSSVGDAPGERRLAEPVPAPQGSAQAPGPSPTAPRAPAFEPAVAWDLQAPQRGDASGTAFLPPPAEAAVVTLRVPAPVVSESMFEAELRCPDGRILTGKAGRLVLDPLARAAFSLPASEFRTEGRYEFVLREIRADGGEAAEFSFRFRVAPSGAG